MFLKHLFLFSCVFAMSPEGVGGRGIGGGARKVNGFVNGVGVVLLGGSRTRVSGKRLANFVPKVP